MRAWHAHGDATCAANCLHTFSLHTMLKVRLARAAAWQIGPSKASRRVPCEQKHCGGAKCVE